jgi:hypothetical protein
MEIQSTEGLRLKGYNATNSGNCGIRQFGISRNYSAFSGYSDVIKFAFSGAAFRTGFTIKTFISIISTSSLNRMYYQEKQASVEFLNWNYTSAGAYDTELKFRGNANDQPGDIGYYFNSGTSATYCAIRGRGLNEPVSAAVNILVFCTHWDRITITYP